MHYFSRGGLIRGGYCSWVLDTEINITLNYLSSSYIPCYEELPSQMKRVTARNHRSIQQNFQ